MWNCFFVTCVTPADSSNPSKFQMGDFRAKQVSFWKKHQTMLQICADLTERCGAKVLVCELSLFIFDVQL